MIIQLIFIFIGLFSVLLFIGFVYAFAGLLVLSGLKVKSYLKINILTCLALDLVVVTKNIRVIKS